MLYKRSPSQSSGVASFNAKPKINAYAGSESTHGRIDDSDNDSVGSNTRYGDANNSLTASTISLVGHQQQQQQQHQQRQHQAGVMTMKTTMIDSHRQHFGLAQIKSKLVATNEPRRPFQFAHHKRNHEVGLTPTSMIAKTMPTPATTATDVPNKGHSRNANKQAQLHDSNATTIINKPRDLRWLRRPPLWQQQRHQQQHAASRQHNWLKSKQRQAETEADEAANKCFARSGKVPLKAKAFMIEFLQGSSIHGFIYLAKIGLNLVERMLWFAFICIALFSIISLSKRTWQRFQTSPMVISMDRNKLVWNTSFPSLTVCPHKRIDELKVDEYMFDNPEHFETEEDKENFRDFIVKLASLSYDNLEILPLNNSFGIPSSKYLEILYELKWHFEPEISSGAAVKMFIYETQTEFGICHSVNSVVARYNSYDYWRRNEWNFLEHGDRVTVHPLDGEIYAQIINLSTAYDVYFHGAGDVPNISKQRYTFPESDYTTVELIALEIYTNEEAKGFTTKQRKCRFQYEAEDMWTVPIYSFGLCLSECRMFFALKVCGCVPHFYRNKLRNGRVLPICGLEGIGCLVHIKREIISLKSDRYKIDCNCLANCDDSNFFVQSYRSRVWFLGANLQWGIVDYPKMQLRRDVLFSFADVLVYIGGLVGFFLGCSALSFTEIVYFFTCRLVKRIFFS